MAFVLVVLRHPKGEYVAPERLENIYNKSDFVDQIFIHGESMKDYLIAVVIPNKAVLKGWAAQHMGMKGVRSAVNIRSW